MAPHKVVSRRQLELLMEWLESDREFAVGRVSNRSAQEKQQTNKKWQEIAMTLNAVGEGVTKTPNKWRDYWSEQKYQVRKKASELRRHACGTGGGPPKQIKLTDMDERILAILGPVSVLGNPCVQIPLDPILTPPELPPSVPPTPSISQGLLPVVDVPDPSQQLDNQAMIHNVDQDHPYAFLNCPLRSQTNISDPVLHAATIRTSSSSPLPPPASPPRLAPAVNDTSTRTSTNSRNVNISTSVARRSDPVLHAATIRTSSSSPLPPPASPPRLAPAVNDTSTRTSTNGRNMNISTSVARRRPNGMREVPEWAVEMEERRIQIEERLASEVSEIRGSVKKIQELFETFLNRYLQQ